MHNKKGLLSVLLLIVMTSLIILGSRGEIRWKEQEEQTDETAWTSKKETIYVWYTDEALESFMGSAAVNFGEAEGVRVIPVLKSSSSLLEDVNDATMDPEKQAPDAYVINNDELEQAYLSGLASEIQNPSGLMNEAWFPRTALSSVTYHGKMVAYPFYFETSVLVYNKDYLDMWVRQQAERAAMPPEEEDEEEVSAFSENCIGADGIPLTVEGLLQFANTFDAPEGLDGVMKWDVADIFYNYWIVGNYLTVGGDCGDDQSNVNIYSEETVKCLQVYQALNQFFFIEPDSVDAESAIQDFMEGKLVFTIGTTEILRRLEEATADGSFAYNYGIAMLPDVTDDLKGRALSVTDAFVVNGYSKHKDLTNRFAEYLTRACSSELYAKTGKMSAALEASRGNQQLQVFMDQYDDSISLPKMMEIGNLWLQLEALFAKVWNGEEVLPLVQELENQISIQLQAE